MRFAPNHDDKMRALRARAVTPETVPTGNSFGEPSAVGRADEPDFGRTDRTERQESVQITRAMVATAVEQSRARVSAHPTLKQLIADRQTVHRVVADGAMRKFLGLARTTQSLPHFARRRE